ncbi:hypothetical protein Agub_g4570 [Astrephomene gubernaculifera]|uniref:Dolichol kinase n=1 Tax=Astrephomene gubernaculifera TaxID=47775 RepID=A0AAD3DKD6_9CHLO|nr:hypothetical protein Agub_g4570 [Astrephomene gubernaculifera]
MVAPFPDVSHADWLAFLQTSAVATLLPLLLLLAGKWGAFDRIVLRKALHIGMGAVFMLHWPLYSNAPYVPYLCASIPLAATLVFALVGLGLVPGGPLVRGATRSGRRQELLAGPLLYGAVQVLLTSAFWRSSPSGVAALAILCFGDGTAELVGRYGRRRLWHNPRKTWAGSAACLIAGAAAAVAYTLLFRRLGSFQRPLPTWQLLYGCTAAAAVAAAVESLPLGADNLTVPLAAAATGVAVFGF